MQKGVSLPRHTEKSPGGRGGKGNTRGGGEKNKTFIRDNLLNVTMILNSWLREGGGRENTTDSHHSEHRGPHSLSKKPLMRESNAVSHIKTLKASQGKK
ncbi:hypothetical protein E2C01_006419 [Portunus trituberculatus]|uniref:Uncharacterized protein n=1 Tax=Portunus trituberculatus TaxID=210409 RepID=A0A5B7CX45_PORTR|nr:hypothetical protein [Portunus trituberculatus]